jgi:hypothetical protein
VHNIWFQQLKKRGACLYSITSYDYVWAFKQMTLYNHFKKGGQFNQGLNRSKHLLHEMTQFGDSKQLANAVLKYGPNSSFIIRITHMEGEEIFGSCKQKANLFLGLKGIQHRYHHVKSFRPRVNPKIAKSHQEIECHPYMTKSLSTHGYHY